MRVILRAELQKIQMKQNRKNGARELAQVRKNLKKEGKKSTQGVRVFREV
jgi:hypothetical protein